MVLKNIYDTLRKQPKDRLVYLVMILIVVISLLYPTLRKIMEINYKLDDVCKKVDRLEVKVDNSPSLEEIRQVIKQENRQTEVLLSRKIDMVYNSGLQAFREINHDMTFQLKEVKAGNKTLLEAMQEMERRNEQRLREYQYFDSLRKNFYEKDFKIDIKPIKSTRRTQ